MSDDTRPSTLSTLLTSGALGVGLVLVAMPSLMLFFGMEKMQQYTFVGLPLLAIFGIMILFGALALVAMLFKSLDLTSPDQPLGLPEGSIRAAIALSLIVLFAIIAILLFRSTPGEPFTVSDLTLEQRNELLFKANERVIAQGVLPCPAPCADNARRYTVQLRPGMASETADLGKQLLILVGTLMTSVTSYYFAARTMQAKKDDEPLAPRPPEPTVVAAPPAPNGDTPAVGAPAVEAPAVEAPGPAATERVSGAAS